MNNIEEQLQKVSQDLKDFDVARSIIRRCDDLDMIYSISEELLKQIKHLKILQEKGLRS
tara:strand:+ start:1304 stop:1480 length:177 start_codon:yes stop_codon:yes gene_type:complete